MPDHSTALTTARAITNRRLPCSVSRCPKRRAFTSQHCANHRKLAALYGHPLGRLVTKQQYQPYQREARRFFKSHQGHPAYLAALDVMRGLLDPGPEPRRSGHTASGLNPAWLVHREITRLADAGVKATDALDVVTALWSLSHYDARILPDDLRLTHALGQGLFRMAPLYAVKRYDKGRVTTHHTKAPAGIAARTLGERIRQHLGVFFVNIVRALDAEEAAQRQRAAALRTPFTQPEEVSP